MADITREGLLEPLLLHLVSQQPHTNEPAPPGLNFLLRPTTPISPSLARAGRSFPELTRLSADVATIDSGGGGGGNGNRATDEEEDEENADADDEMRGYGSQDDHSYRCFCWTWKVAVSESFTDMSKKKDEE